MLSQYVSVAVDGTAQTLAKEIHNKHHSYFVTVHSDKLLSGYVLPYHKIYIIDLERYLNISMIHRASLIKTSKFTWPSRL
jgi:hypothetical protein